MEPVDYQQLATALTECRDRLAETVRELIDAAKALHALDTAGMIQPVHREAYDALQKSFHTFGDVFSDLAISMCEPIEAAELAASLTTQQTE